MGVDTWLRNTERALTALIRDELKELNEINANAPGTLVKRQEKLIKILFLMLEYIDMLAERTIR